MKNKNKNKFYIGGNNYLLKNFLHFISRVFGFFFGNDKIPENTQKNIIVIYKNNEIAPKQKAKEITKVILDKYTEKTSVTSNKEGVDKELINKERMEKELNQLIGNFFQNKIQDSSSLEDACIDYWQPLFNILQNQLNEIIEAFKKLQLQTEILQTQNENFENEKAALIHQCNEEANQFMNNLKEDNNKLKLRNENLLREGNQRIDNLINSVNDQDTRIKYLTNEGNALLKVLMEKDDLIQLYETLLNDIRNNPKSPCSKLLQENDQKWQKKFEKQFQNSDVGMEENEESNNNTRNNKRKQHRHQGGSKKYHRLKQKKTTRRKYLQKKSTTLKL